MPVFRGSFRLRIFLVVSLLLHFLIVWFFYSSEKITLPLEPPSSVEVAVLERENIPASATDLENENIVASPYEKVQKSEVPEIKESVPVKKVFFATTAIKHAATVAVAAPVIVPQAAPEIQNFSSQDLGIKVKYPRLSRMLSEEGRVIVLVQTNELGHIRKMSISNSSGFVRLDEAAMESLSSADKNYDKNSRIKISFLFKLK